MICADIALSLRLQFLLATTNFSHCRWKSGPRPAFDADPQLSPSPHIAKAICVHLLVSSSFSHQLLIGLVHIEDQQVRCTTIHCILKLLHQTTCNNSCGLPTRLEEKKKEICPSEPSVNAGDLFRASGEKGVHQAAGMVNSKVTRL